MGALDFDYKPQLLAEEPKEATLPCTNILGSASCSKQRFQAIANELDPNDALIHCLYEVVRLNQTLRLNYEELFYASTRIIRRNSLYIQNELLQAQPDADKVDDLNHIREACRLGLLVYLRATIVDFRAGKVTYTFILRKLAASVDSLANTNPACLPFTFWAAFIGGLVSLGTAEQPVFVKKLVQMTTVLGFEEWDSVRSLLYEFVWAETLEQGSHRLWDEIRFEMS